MSYPKLTEAEIIRLNNHLCADCNNRLLEGPSGGGSTNYACGAHATCGARFNYGLAWERISPAGRKVPERPAGRIGNLIRDPAELSRRADKLDALSTMTDRVTSHDVKDTAQALRDCADDIRYLLTGALIGCPCARIVGEQYNEVIYVDECPHHGRLKRQLEVAKTAYETAERKLQDSLRTQFAGAALAAAGAEDWHRSPIDVVKRAFQIADEMIAALSRPS